MHLRALARCGARTTEYGVLADDGTPASFACVLSLLEQCERGSCVGEVLADEFTRAVAERNSVYMEWAPMVVDRIDPFRMVLIDAPSGFRATDPEAFAEHMRGHVIKDATSFSFPNLSRNAMLVVPARIVGSPLDIYGHLGAFMRGATREQTLEYWSAVGEQAIITRNNEPGSRAYAAPVPTAGRTVWVSTAGRGVAWLHTRVSLVPSYYRHLPYTRV